MASSRAVSDIDGMGEKTAKKLVWNARNALGMSDFTTAAEIDENVELFTTGSSELNRILGGGFQTGKLTEIYGPFKSGKTNIGHTIAVGVQLPREKGGLDGTVAYIDTENTFSKEKIKRIAKRFGLNPSKVLSNIFHARIYSTDHQLQMIMKSETLCKTRNVRLIIVDSLMALMRNEYVGIGMLARRQAMLNSMLHILSRIAETYNCAVLLTNQVTTKMMGMFSGDDAIGGNITAHGCHFRVMLKNKGFSANQSLKRRAIMVDAPDLPPEECEFFITSVGVADTETVDKPEDEGDSADYEVEQFYEESEGDSDIPLTQVKGIGKGTAENLEEQEIKSVPDLLGANPEDLASKIPGISSKKVVEWQKSAKILMSS